MLTSRGAPDYAGGTLLYRGAEADVVRGKWQGLDAVFKVRKPLAYRLAVLDRSIRRHRTLREAEMIHHVKTTGVDSPNLYNVNPSGATLVMEFIQGDRVRELTQSLPPAQLEELYHWFGRDVAKLHMGGIMHGDLTTANIVRRGRGLVFIDFGLSIRSMRLEDHAVDLRLIKETIVGAHSAVASKVLEALFHGYEAEIGSGRYRAVLRQLHSIERRGRYARVV
jgi:TP53 regulating kinase-like protein